MNLITLLYTVFSVSFAFPTSKVSDGDTKANILENKNILENDLPKFLLVNNSTSDLGTDFILNATDSEENEVMDEVIKITDSELKELKNNVTSEVFDSIKSLINERMINATPSANLNKKEGEVALKSLIETAFKKVVKFVDDKDKINVDVDSRNTTWKKLANSRNELATSLEDDNNNNEKVLLYNKDNENVEITEKDDELGSNENIQRQGHSDIEDEINKQVIIFDHFLTTISYDADAINIESHNFHDSTINSHEILVDRNDSTSNNNDIPALPTDDKENEEEDNDIIEKNLKPLAFSDYEFELTTEYFGTNIDNQNTVMNADVKKEIEEVITEKSTLITDEKIDADAQNENDDDNKIEKEQPHKLDDNKMPSLNQSKLLQNSSVIENGNPDNPLEDENQRSINGKENMEQNNSNFQITSHKTVPATNSQTKKIEDMSTKILLAVTHATDEHSTEEMHDVFISLLEDATDNNVNPEAREDDDGMSSTEIFSSHSNDDDVLESSTQSSFLNIIEETLENHNKTSYDAEQNLSNAHFVLTTLLPIVDDKNIEENEAVVEENDADDEEKEAAHVNRKESQNIKENQDSTSNNNDSLLGLKEIAIDIISMDSTTLPSYIRSQETRLDTEYDLGTETKLRETDVSEIESTTLYFMKDTNIDNENEKKISSRHEQVTEVNVISGEKTLLLSDGKNVNDKAEVDNGIQVSSKSKHNEVTQVTSQQEFINDQLNEPLSQEDDTVTESPVVNPVKLSIEPNKERKYQIHKDTPNSQVLNDLRNEVIEERNHEQQQMENYSDTLRTSTVDVSVIASNMDVPTLEHLDHSGKESATNGKKGAQEIFLTDTQFENNIFEFINTITDEERVVTPPQESYEANQDIINNFDVNLGEDLVNLTNGNEGNNLNSNDDSLLMDLGNVSNNNLSAEKLLATGNDSNINYINNDIDLKMSDKLEAAEALSVTYDKANEEHPAIESTTQVDENDLIEVKRFDTFDASEKGVLESPVEKTITSKLESDNILNEHNLQQINHETKAETRDEGHSVLPLDKESTTIFQSMENNVKENLNHENENQFLSTDSQNEIDLNFEKTKDQQLNEGISQDKDIEIEEKLKKEKDSTLNPVLHDSVSLSKEIINGDSPNHEENNKSDQQRNDSKLKKTEENEIVAPLQSNKNEYDILVDKTSTNLAESPQNMKMLEISSNENKNNDAQVSPEVVSALLEIFNKVLNTYNITLSDDVTTNAKVSNKRKSPKLRTSKTRNLNASSRPTKQFSKEKNSKNRDEKRLKDGANKYVIIDVGSILKKSVEPKTSKSSLQSKDEIPEWREIMEFESTRINKNKENINKENKAAFIPIVKQVRTLDSNGEYSFMFESADGTYRSETGKRIKNFNGALSQVGEYSFLLPNGERFNLKYVADEAGFQPESDYIPRPYRQIQQQPETPKTKRRKLPKRNLRQRKQ